MPVVDTSVLRGRPEAGYDTVSVAGNQNVLLTPAQAMNQALTFSGQKLGNIIVTFPLGAENTGYIYLIENASTGAFTLTVKGTIGTGIVNVPQPSRNILLWTGADFVSWHSE